ncbi:serine protease [Enterobacter asburiae]|uniref:S1 family peptidase n=1 Tax=Enterobacter asburiae TaxID=61645 RepID=UPI002B254BFF|nr:serine protease [Enterobacter asburiae]MEB2409394.1 serine protease [Enterobacter asburiae]HAS0916752.1 trypsin-like peptidase domain-containing protein [Enterobacter asburiae]
MENVHPLSLSTVLIVLKSKGQTVSTGTGFFYADKRRHLFIATNYHVVTGNEPGSGKAPQGDEIEFVVKMKKGEPVIFRIALFQGNEPVWRQHSIDKEADVVLIKLPDADYSQHDLKAITEQSKIPNVQINPSSTVVLIGYPYGLHDLSNMLPIWKTGSIASEPDYDFNGKKLFIVDVSAHPGMSGSPVFYVSHGGYVTKGGGYAISADMQVHFMGIFASMHNFSSELEVNDPSGAQGIKVRHVESLELGNVWKSSLIEEIADSFAEQQPRETKIVTSQKTQWQPGKEFGF